MRLDWSGRPSFWVLNICAATLAVAAVSVRSLCFVAIFLSGLTLIAWAVSIRNSANRADMTGRRTPIEVAIGIGCSFLFWVPIYLFGAFPSLEFNRFGFPILAALILFGAVGLIASAFPLDRLLDRRKYDG